MESKILIESGTNELELLVFEVGGNKYGINVAKVREIRPSEPVTIIPNSHPHIEGIFMPRDVIITAINLAKVLNLPESANPKSDMFIVTNFNKLNVSFRVHRVVGIERISWAEIIVPDKTINSNDTAVATGVVRIKGDLILILDFESIVADISPETGLQTSDVEKLVGREPSDVPIIIAEDSHLLTQLIVDSLHKSGYTNITKNENGQQAWDLLCRYKKEGTLRQNVGCVITDIEMPLMDGHRLIKLVRDDKDMADIPIIIFSSLLNDDMKRKGELLGANAQLSKPEIGNLVNELDRLVR